MRSAVNFKVRTLLVLLGRVINKHFRMNTSLNLESLPEMRQHLQKYMDFEVGVSYVRQGHSAS